MSIDDLQKERIGILGFGLEGQAVAAWLAKNNLDFYIFDKKSLANQDQLTTKALGIFSGEDYLSHLDKVSIIFRSPGVIRFSPELIEFEKNNKITSTTQWFFEHCPCPIIGITGTKGKGTTTTLIYNILDKAVRTSNFNSSNILNNETKVYLTGNIGENSPLDFLDELTPKDVVVYEMSSFQLEDLTISPHISVVLMVTSEHLDHHDSTTSYVDAKANIAKHQTESDFVIYNSDFEHSTNIANTSQGKKIAFSRHSKTDVYLDNGVIKASLHNSKFEINARNKKLLGDHNFDNIMAAASVSLLCGVTPQAIEAVINEFSGLPHRLSLVSEIDNIKFVDDSISTTPESTIAAMESFQQPVILILGGSSKNSDFNPLAVAINKSTNIKAVLLIGSTAQEIAKIFSENKISIPIIFPEGGMDAIFSELEKIVTSGDVVLLSPACASFDQYKNYKDRGEQFTQFAKNFKHAS
jgi:UDP-N-acetylmuramoylalanine--D-glutamate ligase